MTDFTRDRWGRPIIIPADGGKPTPYTRFSSHGQVLEDRFGLEKWKIRTAVKGLTERPDLFAQVAACPVDDKSRLDTLAGYALEAGGSTVGSGLGTALHEFTERVDLGQIDLDTIPDPWRADVAAYQTTLTAHGLTVIDGLIEVPLVNDELRLAGTADRFLHHPDGRTICADLKTGKAIGDNPLGYIAQLAGYANSVVYDIETGARTPIDNIDTTVGYLIHLPAGRAECTIFEVDLVAGLEAARLAAEVRAWQKRRGLVVSLSAPTHGTQSAETVAGAVEPSPTAPAPATTTTITVNIDVADVDAVVAAVTEVFPGTVLLASDERRTWAAGRVRAIAAHSDDSAGALARYWPAGVPTFKDPDAAHTDDHLDRLGVVFTRVEREFEIPFGDSDPATVPAVDEPAPPAPAPLRPTLPDEGRDATKAEIAEVRALVAALDDDAADTVRRIVLEAKAADRPISVAAYPSERRVEIARFLVDAATFTDLDICRAIVARVRPEAADPHQPLGAVIGNFTTGDAIEARRLSVALDQGHLTFLYGDDGAPQLLGDLPASSEAA
jgi:hypothetical protein